MCRRNQITALGLSALILFAADAALADETPKNVRELCRIEVAGALMNAENDIKLLNGQLAIGEQNRKDLLLAIASSEREFRALEQLPPQAIPAFDVDEKVVSLRYRLQTLRGQLQATVSASAENQKKLKESESKSKILIQMSDAVFDWSPLPQRGQPGQLRQLRFRHVCGPYELLCPLPDASSQALRKLLPFLDEPQPCERYSQIRG